MANDDDPVALTPDAALPPAPEGVTPPETASADPAAATETAADAWVIPVPEGGEAFKGDIESFTTDMDGWLKANPNASAREALAEAVSRQGRIVAAQQEQMIQQREAQIGTWEKELKADNDFGGEKFEANVALARKGLEAVASPDLVQIMNDSGLGSHPAVVRAFHKVGTMVADTPFVTAAVTTDAPKSFGERMYPNMLKLGKE